MIVTEETAGWVRDKFPAPDPESVMAVVTLSVPTFPEFDRIPVVSLPKTTLFPYWFQRVPDKAAPERPTVSVPL